MKKLIIDDAKFKGLVQELCRQISNTGWRPDYIVGISRGGLIPAVMISHYFGIPMKPLQISLRDGGDCVSDCGMAEDAYGYPERERVVEDEEDFAAVMDAANSLLEEGPAYKNILVVDDINDTGATFNWLMNDWQQSCLPNSKEWEYVWGNNVKFAVIVDNLASECRIDMDFKGMEVNKAEDDVWIDFPYESWWK